MDSLRMLMAADALQNEQQTPKRPDNLGELELGLSDTLVTVTTYLMPSSGDWFKPRCSKPSKCREEEEEEEITSSREAHIC